MALPTLTRTPTGDPEALARTEWLLTSGTGGFAMGSVLGAPSRRYHGLLVASLRPPVKRVMALSHLSEQLHLTGPDGAPQIIDLSTFRFRPGVLHPRGDANLVRFEKDTTARWYYQAGPISVVKTVQLLREAPAVGVRYALKWTGSAKPVPFKLVLRPLVALRDFHGLILRDTSRDRFRTEPLASGCNVHTSLASLYMTCPGTTFAASADQWWFDFQYEQERERGYDFLEDLFTPGLFTHEVPAGTGDHAITFYASVAPGAAKDLASDLQGRSRRLTDMVRTTRELLRVPVDQSRPDLAALVMAADDFVVRRIKPSRVSDPQATPEIYTIIAGYPWFTDWGRDSMISLPGLLLTTGRYVEAGDVLMTFASACKGGLIPNVFDDYSGQPHYNTVDASLWFIQACVQFLKASGDTKFFERELLPACLDIISAYRTGTSFGISTDPADGLVRAGDESTQLTWMDAKRDGVVFTPRHGKPIEINALWYNALRAIAKIIAADQPGLSAELTKLADLTGQSIRTKFWNEKRSCLYDCLAPDGTPASELRVNQIFAVSLPHSALDEKQRIAVVKAVRDTLNTPHGVRTLDPADGRYRGRYRGRMFDRDASYHNGTAWPWLLGPLAEATLRAGKFSPDAIMHARSVLQPIVDWLTAGLCPGQLPEVVDGDDNPQEPQRPGGCPAQAWSVAEVLRVWGLIARSEAEQRKA